VFWLLGGRAQAQGGLEYLNQADQRRLASPREKAAQLTATGERHLARARELEKRQAAEGPASDGEVKIRKEYERALASFEAALKKDGLTAPAHLGRGEALLALGRRDEGSTECDRAIELAPANTEARLCVLAMRLLGGELDGARTVCQEAATSYPDSVPALRRRLERFLLDKPNHPRREEIAGWLVAPER